MKKVNFFLIFSILFVFMFSFVFPLTRTFSQSFKSYCIGFGPLEGEVGYPVVIDKDSSGKIVILDALKSSIIILDQQNKYLSSFSISNSIPPNVTNVSLKVSLDGYICILLNNTIIKYDFNGILVQTYSFRENRFILGKSILLFAPLSGDTFVFKDDLTGEIYIGSFKSDSEPIKLQINSVPLTNVIDIAAFKDQICLLTTSSPSIEASAPSILLFSTKGQFIKEQSISSFPEIDYPAVCSFDLEGKIYLVGTNMSFIIFSSNLTVIDKITLESVNNREFSKSFCAYQKNSILACSPTKGVFKLTNNQEPLLICPVVKIEKKLFSPSAVCGNRENLFVYDSLTNLIHFYQFDTFKQSFSVDDLTVYGNYQSKISLFQSNSASFFVVAQGLETKIKKIDPANGTSKEIKIPTYISPRCSVYIRQKDNQIYLYSWFDSILYILPENSDLPLKVQINKVENAMFSSDSLCKIDNSDTIFILLPNLKKINVFTSSGSLITGFNLESEGFSYISSFDFYEDLLVTLNHYNSRLDFYSKRGEKLFFTGKKGNVLYQNQLSFPLSLYCLPSKIIVADSGNSRIVIFEGEKLTDKITIELQLGSKSGYVNQKRVELDVAPFTENGRTLVPFRFIGEALGAKVTWFQELKKAIYELGGVKVEIIIGSQSAFVNGKEIKLDVSPKISNGRTFVPIRFVSEALGASVIWEASTKKIIITYPGN
jgi:hypothetical protein